MPSIESPVRFGSGANRSVGTPFRFGLSRRARKRSNRSRDFKEQQDVGCPTADKDATLVSQRRERSELRRLISPQEFAAGIHRANRLLHAALVVVDWALPVLSRQARDQLPLEVQSQSADTRKALRFFRAKGNPLRRL